MKMFKKKHKEIEGKNSYGHGRKWLRVERIVKRKSESIFLAIVKKPKWRFDHDFPVTMAVKSAEMSFSGSVQSEKQVLDDLQGSCKYIAKCYGEELTTSESGDEEIYNLFLEHGTGGTLADHIKKHRNNGLPEFEVRRFTKCILLALFSTHKHGYVVRDLKPENIILVPITNPISEKVEYVAKIREYGSAEEVETIIEEGVPLKGDVKYMSPEAMIDEMQLPASDIWALGCIVNEMLTGKSIWGPRKKNYQIELNLRRMAKGESVLLISQVGKFSKEALSFLLRCLEMNPRDRLTAKELLLDSFVAGVSLDGEDGSDRVTGGDDLQTDIEDDLDGYSSEECMEF